MITGFWLRRIHDRLAPGALSVSLIVCPRSHRTNARFRILAEFGKDCFRAPDLVPYADGEDYIMLGTGRTLISALMAASFYSRFLQRQAHDNWVTVWVGS